MKKLKLILLSTLLSLPLTGYSRIGETFEQCVIRYGNGIKTKTEDYFSENTYSSEMWWTNPEYFKMVRFFKNGIVIRITFIDNTAHEVKYCKDIDDRFDEGEIRYFLSINSSDSKWDLVDDLRLGICEDKKLTSLFQRGNELYIRTYTIQEIRKNEGKRREEEYDREKKNKLNGL